VKRPVRLVRALLVSIAALACSSASGPPASAGNTEGGDTVIAITAKKFEFSPAVVHAQKGQPVVFELVSEDRVHGFSLPDFGVRVDVKNGETTRVRVVPDKTGHFVFRCDVFCGDGHEGMTGELVVE
jgi:cytochrome c oxidase subunit 2